MRLLPTPLARDIKGGVSVQSENQLTASRGEGGASDLPSATGWVEGNGWGKYEPAIARWAEIIGRPAPAPTDGEGRLNPALVEWMMGYPEGWVDGITRTGQLRALGNAIVPHQAAAAWSHLLGFDVSAEPGGESLLPTPRTSDSNGSGKHGSGGLDLRTTVTAGW